jgi:hypothetical protein
MTTLRIDDLNHSKELDASAMAAMSGGSAVETIVGTVVKVANAVVEGIGVGLGLLATPFCTSNRRDCC